MAVIIISLILFQITTLIFAYFFIKERIEKKLVNKEIIEKIKREINFIIMKLNETTINNINLLEEKIKDVDKKIIQLDKRRNYFKKELTTDENTQKTQLELFNEVKNQIKERELSYNPEKIVKQTKQTTEIIKKEMDDIEWKLKNLSVNEKVRLLIEHGWDIKSIQKKLNLTSGEIELLLNMENINK